MPIDTILKSAMKKAGFFKILLGLVAAAAFALGAFQGNWRVAVLGTLAVVVLAGPAVLLEKLYAKGDENSWAKKLALGLVLALVAASLTLIGIFFSSWGWNKPKPLCELLYFGCETTSNEKLIRDAFKHKELGRSLSEGQYVSFSQQQFESGHMFWKARPWVKILTTQGSDTTVYEPKPATAAATAAKLEAYSSDIKNYFYVEGGFARTWLEFSLGNSDKLGRPVSLTQSGIVWSQEFESGTVVYPIPVWAEELKAFHPRDHQFILFERQSGIDRLKRSAEPFAYKYREQ